MSASEIASVRKALDLTLQDLTARTGISVSYLSRAERGLLEPSTDRRDAVNQALAEELTRRMAR
jgi:transcriptional regulator with XRE-family HTH domain